MKTLNVQSQIMSVLTNVVLEFKQIEVKHMSYSKKTANDEIKEYEDLKIFMYDGKYMKGFNSEGEFRNFIVNRVQDITFGEVLPLDITSFLKQQVEQVKTINLDSDLPINLDVALNGIALFVNRQKYAVRVSSILVSGGLVGCGFEETPYRDIIILDINEVTMKIRTDFNEDFTVAISDILSVGFIQSVFPTRDLNLQNLWDNEVPLAEFEITEVELEQDEVFFEEMVAPQELSEDLTFKTSNEFWTKKVSKEKEVTKTKQEKVLDEIKDVSNVTELLTTINELKLTMDRNELGEILIQLGTMIKD